VYSRKLELTVPLRQRPFAQFRPKLKGAVMNKIIRSALALTVLAIPFGNGHSGLAHSPGFAMLGRLQAQTA
jgi:hypothetical protein